MPTTYTLRYSFIFDYILHTSITSVLPHHGRYYITTATLRKIHHLNTFDLLVCWLVFVGVVLHVTTYPDSRVTLFPLITLPIPSPVLVFDDLLVTIRAHLRYHCIYIRLLFPTPTTDGLIIVVDLLLEFPTFNLRCHILIGVTLHSFDLPPVYHRCPYVYTFS